ncbi:MULTISPECIES: PP2C family protein-serine/threonine phosphatase [unclassified Nocardiopsis]|uniref:PP2C family protein-serine/threonine phosphatase n=1 Tax=unclassified Nocardiopsis TaxID=2649073 RepID=UPI0009FA03F1|nr:PP2C family protein-serine/threonine phosphatase [Nocardiopsis sp. TSRI0078]
MGGRTSEGTTGRGDMVLGRILQESHRMAPDELPALLRRHGEALGVTRLTVYLADVQQQTLVALPDERTEQPRSVAVESSLAGWCYRTMSPRIATSDSGDLTLWLPVLDGIERVGVLSVQAPVLDTAALELYRSLSPLIAMIVTTKGLYSDAYTSTKRVAPMQLPAEMVWASLAPRTVGSHTVTSSAVLEPAYNLHGDAFDHTLNSSTLYTVILDAMGHDLVSGLIASVALAAYRNARRNGANLEEIVDTSVSEVFPDRYVTGVFSSLDLVSGQLSWLNRGHPAPLLLRDHEPVPGALERDPEPPLGLGRDLPGTEHRIHRYHLEPGDRVLLYTDGVTEARSPRTGELFGEERFAGFVIRALSAGESAPEALRRLVHAILAHQEDRLTDDATIVMCEWHPSQHSSRPHTPGPVTTPPLRRGARCPAAGT